MKRPGTIVLLTGGGLVALAALGIAFVKSPGPPPTSRGVTASASVGDLMMDLGITPVTPQPAAAFTLETLDGKRMASGDLAGRPALLYFWATW